MKLNLRTTALDAYTEKHGRFPSNLTIRVSALQTDTTASTIEYPRSSVATTPEANLPGVVCPVTSGKQSACNTCRNCWNPGLDIIYRIH